MPWEVARTTATCRHARGGLRHERASYVARGGQLRSDLLSALACLLAAQQVREIIFVWAPDSLGVAGVEGGDVPVDAAGRRTQ